MGSAGYRSEGDLYLTALLRVRLEMPVNEGPMQRARELAVFEFDRRITA